MKLQEYFLIKIILILMYTQGVINSFGKWGSYMVYYILLNTIAVSVRQFAIYF